MIKALGAVFASVWLCSRVQVVMLLERSFLLEGGIASRLETSERSQVRMFIRNVSLHFVFVDHHRALIAHLLLQLSVLGSVLQWNVREQMLLQSLLDVKPRAAHIAAEYLRSMGQHVMIELLGGYADFEALGTLKIFRRSTAEKRKWTTSGRP